MDEKIAGGAGPALAAHSKDASTTGPTTASGATASAGSGADVSAGGVADTVSRLSGQAREAVGSMASSVSDVAGAATERLSEQGGRAAGEIADFVREQPIVALVVTGALCFVLGVLLGRS